MGVTNTIYLFLSQRVILSCSPTGISMNNTYSQAGTYKTLEIVCEEKKNLNSKSGYFQLHRVCFDRLVVLCVCKLCREELNGSLEDDKHDYPSVTANNGAHKGLYVHIAAVTKVIHVMNRRLSLLM